MQLIPLRGFLPAALLALASAAAPAQSLFDSLPAAAEAAPPDRHRVRATFKTTRVANGHSVEMIAARHLDFRISHRFGRVNEGWYNVYGLDKANIRLGFEYGVFDWFNVSLGRSSYQKQYDVYAKARLVSQETGLDGISPVTIALVTSASLNSTKSDDEDEKTPLRDRMGYVHQVLIARKWNEVFSMQLMPTIIVRGNRKGTDAAVLPSLGMGGRLKLTKRTSVNAEYYPLLNRTRDAGTTDALALGFDIETGGHVFQLNLANSTGMIERQFLAETTGRWSLGDIHFGFCISRIFSFKRTKLNKQ